MAVNTQPWFLEHLERYQSDPEGAHDWDSRPVGGQGIVPTLLLETTGAVSGQARALPLLYQPCGEGFILVGSRGGSNRHPAWYLNLLRNPFCSAVVGRMRYRLVARTVSGPERDRYWHLMTRCWPAYLDYQNRTTRELPVVVLRITDATLVTEPTNSDIFGGPQ